MMKVDLTPSWFPTGAHILEHIRAGNLSTETPAGKAARAAIPNRYPQAQIFMAWAVYYGTPDPLTETKKAMQFQ